MSDTIETIGKVIEQILPPAMRAQWPTLWRAMQEVAAEAERYKTALEEIAKQEQSPDMSVDQQLDGDFEGAYNHMIGVAREALTPTQPDGRGRFHGSDDAEFGMKP